MVRLILLFSALFAALLATSCAGSPALTEAGYIAAKSALTALLNDGKIDEATYATMLQTLDNVFKAGLKAGTGWDWVSPLAGNLVTLIAGYFGIRVWRGSPSARKGVPPQ